MSRLSGVNRVLRILLRTPYGLTSRGVYNELLGEGWHMSMTSICPTLSQLIASGDVRKSSEYHACATCGTNRPRYELTRQGKLRIENLLTREEA